ncbi:MAG: 3-mercaptopyruvate sulfurtransferase [Hyphomicrobiales bacterium]|nr:3-mercaptopyruvate sulfurtransferase [Hyphomicrobiales bacterium]
MTQTDTSGPLVSTQWLEDHLGEAGLTVVDGSWYLPAMKRDGAAEYLEGHIPGAVYFDIDDISDHSIDLPHTMPSQDYFASKVGGLGVSESDHIVVYDGGGLFSAPRVWWMFRTFGAARVSILDGGLPKWKAEQRPLEGGRVEPQARSFKPTFNAPVVAYTADVEAALQSGSAQVADARARGRFDGSVPEPRPGLPSGHMPGAKNLAVGELTADGRLKDRTALTDAIRAAGIDASKPVITSCGSGVSAAIINLAFEVSGLPQPRLYDGSWTEWASKGMPVEPKPAG